MHLKDTLMEGDLPSAPTGWIALADDGAPRGELLPPEGRHECLSELSDTISVMPTWAKHR